MISDIVFGVFMGLVGAFIQHTFCEPSAVPEVAPRFEHFPMGADTYDIACSMCKHRDGEDFCGECLCEIKSHWELDGEKAKLVFGNGDGK